MEGPFAHVVYVERTASTNEDAAALLGNDAAFGMTIVAEEQTRGAGRKGRTWMAVPGSSLLFTTILPRDVATADLWCVPFWTAIAVREALARCGVNTVLQWPNDLLLGTRKLAGILCISRVFGERARAGCGVGINVYRTPDAQRIEPPPAFCDDVTHVDRQRLLTLILSSFAQHLALLDDADAVAKRWQRDASLDEKRYRILVDGESEPFDATPIALGSNGSLIADAGGVRRTIALADARILR